MLRVIGHFEGDDLDIADLALRPLVGDALHEDGDHFFAVEMLIFVEMDLRRVAGDKLILLVTIHRANKPLALTQMAELVEGLSGRRIRGMVRLPVDVDAHQGRAGMVVHGK